MTDPTLATAIFVGKIILVAGSRRLRRSSFAQVVVWLVIAAGLITGVCLAIYGARLLAHRRRYNSHSSLFNALCRVHGLDRHARGLLKQVVRHHNLAQPARLFTEPEWLDLAKLGRFTGQKDKLRELGKRLFSESGGPPTPTA